MTQFFPALSSAEFITCVVLIFTVVTYSLRGRNTAGRKNKDQEKSSSTISVTGAAQYVLMKAIAEVHLGVRAKGSTGLKAHSLLNGSSIRLVNYLREQKVSKLQMSGISLKPIYGKTPKEITGYSGRNIVTFEVPAKSADMVLVGSARNGSSEVLNVTLKVAPNEIAIARKNTITHAVANARNEAETAVVALGRTLGCAVKVQIKDPFVGQKGQCGFGGNSTQIGADREQIVSATVLVTFAIA